jgi:hypothetical protein
MTAVDIQTTAKFSQYTVLTRIGEPIMQLEQYCLVTAANDYVHISYDEWDSEPYLVVFDSRELASQYRNKIATGLRGCEVRVFDADDEDLEIEDKLVALCVTVQDGCAFYHQMTFEYFFFRNEQIECLPNEVNLGVRPLQYIAAETCLEYQPPDFQLPRPEQYVPLEGQQYFEFGAVN